MRLVQRFQRRLVAYVRLVTPLILFLTLAFFPVMFNTSALVQGNGQGQGQDNGRGNAGDPNLIGDPDPIPAPIPNACTATSNPGTGVAVIP